MLKFDITTSVRAAMFGAAVAVAAVAAVPAQAAGLLPEEPKRRCDLTGTMAITSEYIFRGISLSNQDPAVQGSVDLACGMFYAGMWASSTEPDLTFDSPIEIDYYAGIAPSYKGFDFDIGVTYYTYPGGTDNADDADYPEIKLGVSKGIGDKVTLGVTYYHAWLADDTDTNTVEGSWSLSLPKVAIFDPSLSGVVGWEENEDLNTDYTYWSVGLSADFHERWTLDVRYWDTDVDTQTTDERVVGTISASF